MGVMAEVLAAKTSVAVPVPNTLTPQATGAQALLYPADAVQNTNAVWEQPCVLRHPPSRQAT